MTNLVTYVQPKLLLRCWIFQWLTIQFYNDINSVLIAWKGRYFQQKIFSRVSGVITILEWQQVISVYARITVIIQFFYVTYICIFTDRIRRMGEGNVFTCVCPSIHPSIHPSVCPHPHPDWLHGGRYASCVHAGGLSCFFTARVRSTTGR